MLIDEVRSVARVHSLPCGGMIDCRGCFTMVRGAVAGDAALVLRIHARCIL
jgi:hypothetical protein